MHATGATHVNFLGKATLQCLGYTDLFVLGKLCLQPCMADESQGCCWIPQEIAMLFGCCAKYGCCPPTAAPTATPTTTPTDAPCKQGTLKIATAGSSYCVACETHVAKAADCSNGDFDAASCLATCFPTAAAVPIGGGSCEDKHASCPKLKKQLDTARPAAKPRLCLRSAHS